MSKFIPQVEKTAKLCLNEMNTSHTPLLTKVCPFCGGTFLQKGYVKNEITNLRVGAYVKCYRCKITVTAQWDKEITQ